eukprot:scaffold1464_cov394-Pavlova_lutheri.AAC.1
MASQWHCWCGHCIHLQMAGTSVQLLVVHLQPPADGSKLSAGAGGAPPATCRCVKITFFASDGGEGGSSRRSMVVELYSI